MHSPFSDPIKDFVKSHVMGVLATVDEQGSPFTSTIFYSVTRGNQIHFITKAQTKKSENLAGNKAAALTVVDLNGPVAVNMTGEAFEVTDINERLEVLREIGIVASQTIHDYAPIVKLQKGSFCVFRFVLNQATMSDFSKKNDSPIESVKEY